MTDGMPTHVPPCNQPLADTQTPWVGGVAPAGKRIEPEMTPAGSSSRIVTIAWSLASVALVADSRRTTNVSSGSGWVSPETGMVKLTEELPAGITARPLRAS